MLVFPTYCVQEIHIIPKCIYVNKLYIKVIDPDTYIDFFNVQQLQEILHYICN